MTEGMEVDTMDVDTMENQQEAVPQSVQAGNSETKQSWFRFPTILTTLHLLVLLATFAFCLVNVIHEHHITKGRGAAVLKLYHKRTIFGKEVKSARDNGFGKEDFYKIRSSDQFHKMMQATLAELKCGEHTGDNHWFESSACTCLVANKANVTKEGMFNQTAVNLKDSMDWVAGEVVGPCLWGKFNLAPRMRVASELQVLPNSTIMFLVALSSTIWMVGKAKSLRELITEPTDEISRSELAAVFWWIMGLGLIWAVAGTENRHFNSEFQGMHPWLIFIIFWFVFLKLADGAEYSRTNPHQGWALLDYCITLPVIVFLYDATQQHRDYEYIVSRICMSVGISLCVWCSRTEGGRKAKEAEVAKPEKQGEVTPPEKRTSETETQTDSASDPRRPAYAEAPSTTKNPKRRRADSWVGQLGNQYPTKGEIVDRENPQWDMLPDLVWILGTLSLVGTQGPGAWSRENQWFSTVWSDGFIVLAFYVCVLAYPVAIMNTAMNTAMNQGKDAGSNNASKKGGMLGVLCLSKEILLLMAVLAVYKAKA